MDKFTKKPIPIAALRNEGEWAPILSWLDELAGGKMSVPFGHRPPITRNPDGSLNIETREGVMRAEVGDWILQGIQGEFYPCKPDIFADSYEPAAGPLPGETTTSRGFRILTDFEDLYGERFSVQESSLAYPAAVWVGEHNTRGHLDVTRARYVRDALSAFIAGEES